MALVYPDSYDDTFIINSVSVEDHEKAEADSIVEAGKLLVVEPYYLEKIVVYLTYIRLVGLQIEAEGMATKASHYRKEYDRTMKMSRHGDTDAGVFSAAIGRA